MQTASFWSRFGFQNGAEIPTWITLDNESVVEQAQKIIGGCNDILKNINSRDLWKRVANFCALHHNRYFKVTWIKGHLDLPANKAYTDEGIFTEKEKEWHVITDDMATQEKTQTLHGWTG